jgi:hypothetical protein
MPCNVKCLAQYKMRDLENAERVEYPLSEMLKTKNDFKFLHFSGGIWNAHINLMQCLEDRTRV